MWCSAENPIRLFDFTNTRFEAIFRDNAIVLDDLSDWLNTNFAISTAFGETCPKLPVYRPGIVHWQNLKSLSINYIKPNNIDDLVFLETHNTEDSNVLDPERQITYHKNLKNEIKRALLEQELKFQKEILGYFKPPDHTPMNAFYLNNLQNQNDKWMIDWSWMTNSEVDLPDFSLTLVKDTLTEYKAFIRFQKERLRFFRDSQKLDCHQIHLDDINDARRYVKKLKIYSELIGNLFSQTSKGLEKAICRIARIQNDLSVMMERTMAR